MGARAVKLYVKGVVLFVTFAGLILSLLISRAGKTSPESALWLQFASTLIPFILAFHFSLLIYWIYHLKIWFLIPLIAISINYKFLTSILGVSWSTAPNETTINLTVCSYNVNYFNHSKEVKVPAIASLVQDNGVDILAIQEFEAISYYNLDEIIGEFDFMEHHAIYATDKGAIGMAIFSKYPIIKSSKVKFDDTGNGFMWADILIGQDTVRVINNHLQTTGYYSSYSRGLKYVYEKASENFLIRAGQAKIIRSLIDSTSYPVIVCGDFNDTPNGFVYNVVKGDNLADSFVEKGIGLGGTYRRTLSLMRIDMILVSNHFKVHSYKAINSKLSDHKPIFSVLEYRN